MFLRHISEKWGSFFSEVRQLKLNDTLEEINEADVIQGDYLEAWGPSGLSSGLRDPCSRVLSSVMARHGQLCIRGPLQSYIF